MRAAIAMAVAVSPTVILSWLLATPGANSVFNVPVQHVVVTTNVSVVALLAGVLVARAALAVRQFGTVLVALGFITMAGFFTVHALSTPNGGLVSDPASGLVTGVSAQLALLVPAVVFALRYTRVRTVLERRIAPGPLIAAVVTGLIAYGVIGLGWPSALAGLAGLMLAAGGSSSDYDPSGYGYGAAGQEGVVPYLAVGTTFALYAFSAWSAWREFRGTRLPLPIALAFAFALLAQAQLSQFLGPVWSAAWWGYHGLMLAAVTVAVGAIFLELDRRRGLERFLPSAVVDRVLAGDAKLVGERKTVTILFADLRGSTALADRVDPESAVAVMNGYIRAFAACVLEHRGILDKFTGDGIMAIFGAGGDVQAGVEDAVAAALDMRGRLARLTAEREAAGQPTLGYGVGMHTGDVVLGAVGLPERSDYTALGDTVNTASRMESLTKELGVDIVVTAEIARRLDPGVAIRLGEADVKGKSAPLEVFGLG